jgi:hypothetical protein
MRKRRSIAVVVVIALAAIALFAGCESSLFTQFEHWDHEIAASEFTPHGTLNCLVYSYNDDRFNDVDLFDTYMVADDGVSDFDSTFDETLGVFLYAPVYDAGSVTFLAHTGADTVLAGETLRFYRIWK